jgi:hypothetical protein
MPFLKWYKIVLVNFRQCQLLKKWDRRLLAFAYILEFSTKLQHSGYDYISFIRS